MKLCGDGCIPCCDFCKFSLHGDLERDGTTGPIGCILHLDKEHQDEAVSCGYCEDFWCSNAKESVVIKTLFGGK